MPRVAPRVARVGALVGAAVLLAPVACTGAGDDEQVRVVAPSAVASAVGGVTSGRFEISTSEDDEGESLSGWFQDDDFTQIMGPVDGRSTDDSVEVRFVDGVAYNSLGIEAGRWMRMRDGSFETDELVGGWLLHPGRGVIDAVADLDFEAAGEPAVLEDGREVTRYTVHVKGKAAGELINATMGGRPMSPTFDAPEPQDELWALYEAPYRRITEYELDHTTGAVTIDLDASGAPVRVEAVAGVDLSEFPDCLAFSSWDTQVDVRAVITDLDEPLPIDPPPTHVVDDWEVPGLDETGLTDEAMEDLLDGETPDPEDVAAMAEEMGMDPSELAEALGSGSFGGDGDSVVQTSAGPRKRNVALRSLIQWATERGIDWTKVPVPDDRTLVAMYDQFFAEELQARGPALATADGLWSRGDVLDVLTVNGSRVGADPTAVRTMSDQQLVEHFDQLVAMGDLALLGLSDDEVPDMYGLEEDLEACPS